MTQGTSTSGRSLCFRTISRFCCIARITATSGHPYGRIRSERYSFNLKKIEDTWPGRNLAQVDSLSFSASCCSLVLLLGHAHSNCFHPGSHNRKLAKCHQILRCSLAYASKQCRPKWEFTTRFQNVVRSSNTILEILIEVTLRLWTIFMWMIINRWIFQDSVANVLRICLRLLLTEVKEQKLNINAAQSAVQQADPLGGSDQALGRFASGTVLHRQRCSRLLHDSAAGSSSSRRYGERNDPKSRLAIPILFTRFGKVKSVSFLFGFLMRFTYLQ